MKKIIALLLITVSLLTCTTTAFANNQNCIPDEQIIIDPDVSNNSISISNASNGLLYTMTYTKDVVYSTVSLNVRQRPTTLSAVEATVCPGHEFYRVAHSDFGWDLIMEDDEYFFVWNEYLTTEKPSTIDNSDFTTGNTQISYDAIYTPSQFQYLGVIYYGDFRWTWYTTKQYPGESLNIPGRYTDEQGYVRDGDGYLCLASNDLSKGTVVATPFGGQGKVYDSGCPSGTLDVYVTW